MPLCSLYISNSTYVRNNLLPENPYQPYNFLYSPCDFFIIFFCFSPGNALTSGGSRLFDTKTNPERKPLEIPSEFAFVCTLFSTSIVSSEFAFVCTLFSTYIVPSEFDNDMSFIQSGHLYCLLVSHWVGKEKVLFGNSFGHFLFSCKFHSAWKDGCCWGKGKN